MKIFLFYFEMAIKNTGSAQNYRVGRVSGNTPIFLGLIKEKREVKDADQKYYFSFTYLFEMLTVFALCFACAKYTHA